ncbi:MAG: mechanosensitive ion channel family protein [Rhodothermales bacterium]|nr:mechanosensitive ion channel family protein [Rhodothermales bacterium]
MRVLLLAVTLSLASAALAVPPQEAPTDTTEATPLGAEAAPDSALAARLRGVFGAIEEFEAVRVGVRNGVVRLAGTVPDDDVRDEAAALAGRFEGVLYVDDDLEVATDVETRVSPALERVQSFWDRAVASLPVLGVALVVLFAFALLARLAGGWAAPFERLGVRPLVRELLQRTVAALLFLVGLLLALDVLGVTALVGAVLGTAGVVGLAIGFAFQDIVENYLAGVLLSVRQPFAVGDLVDVEEHHGKVVRLTARELVLMTIDGNHLRLPNATVFKSAIVNYTRNPLRRFSFTLGIANEEDLTAAMQQARRTLDAMNGVLEDPPPFARVEALADSNVTVQVAGWVDQREADFVKVRSEAVRLVKAALDEAGIEMPEPIYRVNLVEFGPPTPPDAPPQAPVSEQAGAVDVAPETDLDAQVHQDLAASDEENLLG